MGTYRLPLSKVGYTMLGDTSLNVWQEKTYLVMWTKYCGQTQPGEEMKRSIALVTALPSIFENQSHFYSAEMNSKIISSVCRKSLEPIMLALSKHPGLLQTALQI